MTYGYGEGCARQLGLLGDTVDVGQDGPDLFDAAGQPSPRED
jgi:hypothetical protein